MRYLIIAAALMAAAPAQAGFLDELFGDWTASAQHINKSHASHHVASWYNDRSGRTASGMRVHYGVAHRTLPFGTRVQITNPRNGRTVTAVVTDRGPFVRGRTIDVNQNVARALGFSGVAPLHMEVVR